MNNEVLETDKSSSRRRREVPSTCHRPQFVGDDDDDRIDADTDNELVMKLLFFVTKRSVNQMDCFIKLKVLQLIKIIMTNLNITSAISVLWQQL